MKKIIRLGLAFLIISFMVVSFQKFDCAAAVKTINVFKTEYSGPVPHLQKKAPTSQLFSFLKDSPDVIASGTSGTCDWKITADGILTIDKGQLATGTVPHGGYDPNGIYTNFGGSNWTANGNKDKIKEVDIKPGVSLPKDATAVFANLPNVTEIEGLENLDISETTNMSHLFDGCYKLTSINLSNFNTGKVTDMSYMFSNCGNLTSLDVSKFDTSLVTDMSYMFYSCGNLTSLDVSKFDTSQVTNMSNMFHSCGKLTSLNVSNFNTSKVTNMTYMFGTCATLTTLDLSNLDTSKVDNMSNIFNSLKVWKLTLGNNFELKDVWTWPWPRESSLPYTFSDGKLRYITITRSNSKYIKDFEWREVGTGNPHNPRGTIYKTYSNANQLDSYYTQGIADATKKAVSNKTPITFVWNNRPYNASPSLTFTDSSYKNPIKLDPYAYPYDSNISTKDPAFSYPALNIYGTLRDEDSSQVTLSYWIDDNSTNKDDNSTNKKEVKTVDTTSSNGEENTTKVNWSFAITDEDDLTALATPEIGGHTIHVEARDNGIDGQSQEVFEPVSATFEVPVAENAIVQFDYQDLSGKPLRDSQTLVRGATESNINYSDGYRYDVKQYVPQYLWEKDKDNNLQRYSLSNYDYKKLILENCDWGHINGFINMFGNLKSTGAQLKKIPLKYDKSGTISLEVPHLNFGSYIRQAMPSKCGLKYSVDKPPKLAVKDTTKSYNWKLYLSITKFTNIKDPSKTLDKIFFYDDTPVDSGSEAIIATGGDFSHSNITDCDISKNWYENNGTQVKLRDYYRGPWLNLQGQRPAEGKYQATATWTLKNTPQ